MLRRTFVKAVGSGTLAVIGGRILDGGRVVGPWTRGFEEALAAAETPLPLLLHNNENPLGPGEKALNAIREKLVERGVPAARYTSLAPDLAAMIAARYKCKEENVLVGCGSTQILRTATLLFTSPERPLVAGSRHTRNAVTWRNSPGHPSRRWQARARCTTTSMGWPQRRRVQA